jgi:protein transport protein SEC24
MAASQEGYPPQEGYGQPVPGYGHQGSPEPPAPSSGPTSHSHIGGKKKRAYAGEAFEFGAGANAALGGQQQGGGGYGTYAGHSQAAGYPPPAYNTEASPVYSQPQAAAVGGYQAPATGYPAPSYPAPNRSSVTQITQQFDQMGVSAPRQTSQQSHQAPRPIPLNQLYPADLLSQPFNVAELDYPPPPIVLPSNVCRPDGCCLGKN